MKDRILNISNNKTLYILHPEISAIVFRKTLMLLCNSAMILLESCLGLPKWEFSIQIPPFGQPVFFVCIVLLQIIIELEKKAGK